MTAALAPVSARAPAEARTTAGAWTLAAAAVLAAAASEPLLAAVHLAQGLAEPPGWSRLVWLPFYLVLLGLAARDWRVLAGAARAAPVLAALALVPMASALWSIDPGASLRRGLILALTMLLGFWLAARLDWRGLALALGAGFALLIAGTVAVALLAPEVGLMRTEHPGAWAGLWTHKNTLGGVMALGTVCLAAAAGLDPRRRLVWALWAAGALTLVALSTSKTALVTAAAGLGLMAAAALARRGPSATVAVCAGAAAMAALAAFMLVAAPQLATAALGRDASLTGRTDIWAALDEAIAAKPWLGYGYRAFWENPLGPAFWVTTEVQWGVKGAHSGWRETALGLGVVGLVLCAAALAPALARAVRALAAPAAGLLAAPALVTIGLGDLTESHTLSSGSVHWLVATAVAARLALDARGDRA